MSSFILNRAAQAQAEGKTGVKGIGPDRLIRDPGVQMRAKMDAATVAEYREIMLAASGWGPFPAIVAYEDEDGKVWAADGFHRIESYIQAGFDDPIPVDLRKGSRRDAVLYAVGANATHGLRRTNEDKRKAVAVLLADPEWAAYSDRELARIAGVSHDFVNRMRRDLVTAAAQPTDNGAGPVTPITQERTYITKHGTPTTRTIEVKPARTKNYVPAQPDPVDDDDEWTVVPEDDDDEDEDEGAGATILDAGAIEQALSQVTPVRIEQPAPAYADLSEDAEQRWEAIEFEITQLAADHHSIFIARNPLGPDWERWKVSVGRTEGKGATLAQAVANLEAAEGS